MSAWTTWTTTRKNILDFKSCKNFTIFAYGIFAGGISLAFCTDGDEVNPFSVAYSMFSLLNLPRQNIWLVGIIPGNGHSVRI